MGDTLLFANDNQRRMEAVQKCFGPSGTRILDPGRVLVGEGRLMKQSRRGAQPKAFFLFNDMLVYGSIVINGRWFKKQKIIPLGDIELEDLEDGYMRHQWLIKAPGKSFFVSAASREEKVAWIRHIEVCKTRLPSSGRPVAMTWIPDRASAICMRCSRNFSVTHRRHHCRKCGFLVCGSCSRKRAVIGNIHPTKRQRVCVQCHSGLSQEEDRRGRGDSIGLPSDEDESGSFEDHLYEDFIEDEYDLANWDDSGMDSFCPYVYIRPEHVWPSHV
ncbi:pleckstrin homology domain-containing family F member 2-like [Periophthalmus magnuspinnatus]|uniref:pleckstrin homology domain-containing family F member 2-like n=1 Tax=Periophthalmus magnuspinnatus TaxID=409849 RepID=UPI00145A2344|nr:pleckstrin homology domain-containing family F member 2-like [Periophthalmus magnuspinnatus]